MAKRARTELAAKDAAAHGPAPPAVADGTPLFDAADFAALNEATKAYDAQRDAVIRRSRDMQKAAKTAIYCLHRADAAGAERELTTFAAVAAELQPVITAEPSLRHGGFSAAVEEYTEAAIFKHYLATGRLMAYSAFPQALAVTRDEYLGGLLDFTGELNRFAVLRATARDTAAVARARDVADAVFGQMLQFDLRNGAARKKFDTLKYTLKKLESLLYEMQLSGPAALRDGAEEPAAQEAANGAAGKGDGDAADGE